jgi:hypothetical protein
MADAMADFLLGLLLVGAAAVVLFRVGPLVANAARWTLEQIARYWKWWFAGCAALFAMGFFSLYFAVLSGLCIGIGMHALRRAVG